MQTGAMPHIILEVFEPLNGRGCWVDAWVDNVRSDFSAGGEGVTRRDALLDMLRWIQNRYDNARIELCGRSQQPGRLPAKVT